MNVVDGRTIFRGIVWLGLAGAVACNDPSGVDNDPGPPVNMAVVGHGQVSDRFTSEVAVLGTIAYTGSWSVRAGVSGNAVKVWDVSGATPAVIDSLIIPGAGTTGDVQISDDGALLVIANEYSPNGAITLFGLSDPRRPQHIRRFTSEDIAAGVHTVKLGRVGGRHYAFLCINQAGGRAARLVIVDITTPASPQQVWSGVMGRPFVHDVFVRNGLLFTALWDDGMSVWDIGGGGRGGSPANPVMLGNVQTVDGNVHNIHWFHDPRNSSKRYVIIGEEVASSPSAGDIHVVDASDFGAMREVAYYRVEGAGTHNFTVDEANGILYAAYYEAGVRALDIRGDLGSCNADERLPGETRCDLGLMQRERGHALTGSSGVRIWGVALNDTHLFASDMLSGLFKIDNTALR